MKNFLKNLFLSVCLLVAANVTFAQVGLEGIEVETYYVSTPADQAAWGLPVGAKTYRVYANLATGWSLQSLYGGPAVVGSDIDSLVFFSSTNFWNDANGGTFPQTISNSGLATGAAALDSYLSFGGGGGTRRAILRSLDLDGGIAGNTLTGTAGGGLLSANDGRFNTGVALSASGAGFDPDPDVLPLGVFNNNAVVGNRFSTAGLTAGAAVLAGGAAATGPGADNRVLLGQFTTAGTFGYHINIQIGQGATIERYVASSPVLANSEFTIPSLILTPNTPPSVAITTPSSNVTVVTGTAVPLVATATDVAPGTVAQVEFFNGATSLFVDTASPFEHTFTATANASITAVATDNQGATSTSAPRTITVSADPAPVVTNFVASPVSPAAFGTAVMLTATATDNGSVVSAQFRDGATLIGALITGAGPYTASWTAATAGPRTLSVTVTDNAGNTTSQTLAFTVTADPAPVVTVFTAAPTSPQLIGATITLSATATDNGSVVSAQFRDGATNIGALIVGAGPYTTSWTPTLDGSRNLSVVVTDNVGNTTTSTLIPFIITPSDAYEIRRDTALCTEPNICVPIQSLQTVTDVIGYDLVLSYNESKVIPTGVIRKYSDLAPSNLFETTFNIKNTPTTTGEMLISVFFNSNAPLNQRFAGAANSDLICVEFLKRPAYGANELVIFNIDTLEESYITGVVPRAARGNGFLTYRDSTLNSKLEFWADNSALGQDDVAPFTGPVTNIFGANATCVKALNPVNPNANGEFTHFLNNNELFLNIERDIQGGAVLAPTNVSVQSVINGFDAFLVRRVLLDDPTFVPSIYQMIAMDVNMDGQVSAGDASQINQRSVLQIAEFRQKWNYTNGGASNGQLSKDWLFINELTILNNTDGSYSVSSIYPAWDLTGYNKDNVPTLAFCMPTPVSNWAGCPEIGEDKYIGILLGDANGNFQNLVAGVTDLNLRTNKTVVFDINNAVYNADNTVDVPVSMVASNDVNSIDFAMEFNNSKLEFNNVVSHRADVQAHAFVNPNDETLRLTSNGTNSFVNNAKVVSVRFNLPYGKKLTAEDFVSTEAYLNGELVKLEVRDRKVNTANVQDVTIYPNPVVNNLRINVGQDAKAQLFDISGKAVSNEVDVYADKNNELNVQNFTAGIYTLKVYNDTFVSTKKVIVTK